MSCAHFSRKVKYKLEPTFIPLKRTQSKESVVAILTSVYLSGIFRTHKIGTFLFEIIEREREEKIRMRRRM